jgi:hypothetical protein
MFDAMDTVNHNTSLPAPPETEAERQRRFAWETERIAEADAEIAAGFYVDSDDVDAWIDSIGTDHELPVPYTRRALRRDRVPHVPEASEQAPVDASVSAAPTGHEIARPPAVANSQ